MDTSTVVMMAAAVVTLVVIYWKSPQAAGEGLSATGALILEIIPRMVAAFTLAGLIQAVVPQETIVRWMGHGSGAKGILIGMTLGRCNPRWPDDSLSDYRLSLQGRGGSGPAGFLSDGLVSFRAAAYYHVGDSLFGA
jgi:hypothetical protein